MSIPWEPRDYQLRAAELLVERSHSGLFLKPGLGKSSITLAAFTALHKLKMTKAMLILAPLRVIYTSWPQELRKWDEFKCLSFGVLHGKNKDKVLSEKHDVYLCNYEGLPWLCDQLSGMKTWPFDMLVSDECTKLKNANGRRFKQFKPFLKGFKRRYILTGSPTANGLLDLFGQCYIMDSGESLGPYITKFRNEFFNSTGFGGYTWVPKTGSEDRIHAILAPRVFYAHDADYLQLPELIEKDVIVELPHKAAAIYKQLEDALRLDFKSGKVTSANAAVAAMKCRQVANGGIYLDGLEKIWENVHDAKVDAVCDIVEELSGQPTLVTYDFLHDLDRLKKGLKKLLGHDVPHVGKGGVSPANLPALIAAWNRNEVPVIIVNPQSMSHGVDGLQEAGRAIIWHSLDYNFENYDQLIRRLRRSGQRERVLVAHILAKDTVDIAVLKALRAKDKKQNNLFMALRDYWAE